MSKVLVVEDDSFNQIIVEDLLEDLGHDAVCAGNGQEAIDLLKKGEVDISVILMDCQMPVMDGFIAASNIRDGAAGDNIKSTPIIALTGNTSAEDKQHCLDAGMNDYLSKPLEPEDLAIKLQEWL